MQLLHDVIQYDALVDATRPDLKVSLAQSQLELRPLVEHLHEAKAGRRAEEEEEGKCGGGKGGRKGVGREGEGEGRWQGRRAEGESLGGG